MDRVDEYLPTFPIHDHRARMLYIFILSPLVTSTPYLCSLFLEKMAIYCNLWAAKMIRIIILSVTPIQRVTFRLHSTGRPLKFENEDV